MKLKPVILACNPLGDTRTDTPNEIAITDMFIIAVRSSYGTRRAKVRLGKKTLHPQGTMRLRLRLRQGDLLSVDFTGDGHVAVFGYHVPSRFRTFVRVRFESTRDGGPEGTAWASSARTGSFDSPSLGGSSSRSGGLTIDPADARLVQRD